ncbi:MAG: T9SS type A sorting domain-containing protein [Flavisolibacter sp.]
MKTLIPFLFFVSFTAQAQITTPIIRAGFGVDADLRARYFSGSLQNGNDDWFMLPGTGLSLGEAVIDTTGAAAIVAGYTSDVSPFPKRMTSFYRTMSHPQFSVVNNRLWLDALFVRDYHGNDTTVFTSGADKNGDSPVNWSGGIQSIPDKNDILDMFMHVRRAGSTATDSLWMFGGISLDNTTGNRYFDFEMYQTDINYDRASHAWYGYGPDAGHTSWKFDASGNIIKPGDIIFSASYQSSALTNIEARIWVDRAALSITPASFNWSGQFDGAATGSQFGYASILPKTGGAYYTGLGSGNNTWAGPFQLILQNNSQVTNYSKDQFMEFSVNLTKIGLDPVTTFGTDVCGTPFNRLVVKTRASASFTSELKDFVAPTDLFLAPRVDALADVPIFCGTIGVSNLKVTNPSSSSIYTWSTTDGHIVGTNSGTSINADSAGTYVVKQQLAVGCNPYAYDTVKIVYDAGCVPLASKITGLRGVVKSRMTHISWISQANQETRFFEIQRSHNGRDFESIGKMDAIPPNTEQSYFFDDPSAFLTGTTVYYRIKAQMTVGFNYSAVVKLDLGQDVQGVGLFPNPVSDVLQISVPATERDEALVSVFDVNGALLRSTRSGLTEGLNLISLDVSSWKPGTYIAHIVTARQNAWKRFVVSPAVFK